MSLGNRKRRMNVTIEDSNRDDVIESSVPFQQVPVITLCETLKCGISVCVKISGSNVFKLAEY